MAYFLLAVIGILGGIVSGLFGVGGGLIFVPLLVLWRSFNPHVAIATSLAVVVPTALIGVLRHVQANSIDWRTVAIMALFSAAGAWLGASISVGLDTLLLRRLFAVFLLFLAFKMFFPN